MYLLLKMGIFHCYVSLPEGRSEILRAFPRRKICQICFIGYDSPILRVEDHVLWYTAGNELGLFDSFRFSDAQLPFFFLLQKNVGVEPKIGVQYPPKWMLYNGEPY